MNLFFFFLQARPRAVLAKCHVSSLNLTGHFILETEDSLFHYKGPKADVSKLKFAVKVAVVFLFVLFFSL